MSVELKVPVLPESVADATVGNWHKKPGDMIRRDENLVDLETDKVVLEVPSPCDGTLVGIQQESGAVVTNGELLALIEEGAAEESAADNAQSAQPVTETSPTPPAPNLGDLAELSPAVRRLVEEHSLDHSAILGSGRDGRLTKEDVLKHMKSDDGGEAPSTKVTPAQPAPTPALGDRAEERVSMSRLRQRISERMVEANNTAAMLTSFNEVNLQAVMDLRKRYKESFADRHGVKLGFMSFFVKACADALRKYPVVNASIDGSDIVYHGYQDIGIAVSTDRGLMVPILRNAGQMSFAAVEQSIAGFAGQARDGSIRLEDLQGGTFTITNGGVFGSLVSTPILNMPQSAILGMHAIKDRPVAENGEVVIRPMMYLALTYDHRIVDGRDAVLFLVSVKESLEDPSRMILEL